MSNRRLALGLGSRVGFGLWGAALALALASSGCSDPRNDVKPDVKPSSKPTTTGSSTPITVSQFGANAVKELDTSKLNDREKDELAAQLDEVMSPCADSPVSLAQCLAEKRSCKTCKPAGELLARLIRSGAPRVERKAFYETRFDPKEVKTIDIDGAPSKGPADAPVTLIEFADFECPHCAMMRVILELMQERFPDQIRLVYKVYALPGHTHAPDAAYAALAADRQGKFWEMHKMLFEHQDKLERKDLIKYARDLDLDVDQFKKDFEDPELRKQLEKSIQLGDELKITGTPTMYVNGRSIPFDKLTPFYEEFESWLKLEIEMKGKKPAEPSPKFATMMKELGGPEATPEASASASAGPAVPPPTSASASAGAAPSAAPKAPGK